jgi:phenylalanyl-tRNA synthetase beta chain
MKFSFDWLKDLSGYTGTAQQLAELLSTHAVETEIEQGLSFPGIIVAKVLKVEKHPNADRLRIVELTDGENTYAPVVCGAWNFEAGAIVPLALPGALIPHNQHDAEGKPFTLGKAVIRGVESQGMICSGKELGLSDEADGILKLDPSYRLGEEFAPKHQAGPKILDISVPANRPDLISYQGLAREIAALTGKSSPKKPEKNPLEKLSAKLLKVSVSETNLCPRYIAVRLSNIEIKPSPEFIRKRLNESGLRPINNVVDITNYVMLETGQPLHAFDSSKSGTVINVRKAYVNETLTTLDGQARKLSPDMLVIADSRKAIAIAGVIGGRDSMVDESSNEIILESANFNPLSIRRTARDLNLRTDASLRFEKNLPISFADTAAAYAVELLKKYAAAEPIEAVRVGKPAKAKSLNLDTEKVNSLLGIEMKASDQKQILSKLGFRAAGAKDLKIEIPEYRNDIAGWEDLAEEIMRFKGLDAIPSRPFGIVPSAHMTDEAYKTKERLIDMLTGLGADQIYTYSFISKDDAVKWDIPMNILVEVANPLSHEQQYLRPNLIINALKVVERNSKHAEEGCYFEIGNIYWKDGKDYEEKTYLSVISFDKIALPSERIVAVVKELLTRLKIKYSLVQENEQSAVIKSGKEILGRIATFPVSDAKWTGAHIDLEKISGLISNAEYIHPSKYPPVILDVAVLVRKDLPWSQIEDLVRAQSELIRTVELFDIYQGKNIPTNRKSLAFRVVYQADDHTLTEKEVLKIHKGITDQLAAKFSAEIRE